MARRMGVLGVGRIGRMHADLLANRIAGTQVQAVFDVVAEAATDAGSALGVDVCTSLDDLLARDDIDAVCVATSTDTHVDTVVAAAEAGKAIFCEKPVSLDLSEVDRALASVDAAGVAFQVGFNRRFDAGHASVRSTVADKTIGDLHLLRITSRDPAPPPISYVQVSGGIFRDMMIHDFDMARFVTGSEVIEVFARGAVRVDPAIGEAGDLDTAVVVMTHADGTITTIDNSRQAVYGYDQRVEAFGSGGMATSENLLEHAGTVATAEGVRSRSLQHFFIERYSASYISQWEAFVEAVTSGTAVPVTGVDGRAPLLIAEACLTSLAEGRAVTVATDASSAI